MKALIFHGVGDVRCESVPEPTLLEPSDALVKVAVSAVCGSDLHVYRGREQGLDQGTVMGHEFAGEIVAVGREVRKFKVGQNVVSPFTTNCGACFYCQSGLTARCHSGQLFGWIEGAQGLHGAQAEFVRVPLADATLLAHTDVMPAELALFAGDILATGLFCAERAEVERGKVAAVIGCGPVGLMSVVAARELGARRVFAFDRVPERLKLAERFGASAVDVSQGDALEQVREMTEGRGADSVLEVVGTPEATRLAFELARPGGVIAAAGVHTELQLAFSPGEAYDKNLTYRAGRCSARHYMNRALEMIALNQSDLEVIITHRLALAEGARAYQLFETKTDGCIKAVLRSD